MTTYWESFYKKNDAPQEQSSFAEFISQRFSDIKNIIDVGCGNGRDSIFFASLGYNVIGIDRSNIAISLFKKESLRRKVKICNFYEKDIIETDFFQIFDENKIDPCETIIYSRFFLHAIGEEAEQELLKSSLRMMRKGTILCLEFRSTEDKTINKVFPHHYRRFIETSTMKEKCISLGMRIDYAVSGRGIAPYKGEDPFVSRLIMGAMQ